MIGTKPTMIIVRQFRGVQLFLSNVTRAPKGFTWTNNRKQAQRYDAAEALALAYEASRDYGAECATLDVQGNLAQPGKHVATQAPTMRDTIARDVDARAWSVKS